MPVRITGMIRFHFWLLTIALLLPTPAMAWGKTGHRLIARLAEAQLTPQAQRQVQALLAGEDATDLAGIASWADDLRKHDPQLGKRSASWHYVNLADHECNYEFARDCPGGNCLVEAIRQQTGILADTSKPHDERVQALKFVVHFVGDAHQPLHSGFAHDRGGNDFQVNFRGKGSNLHSLWDSGMLYSTGLEEDAYFSKLQSLSPRVTARKTTLPPNALGWSQQSCRIVLQPGFQPASARIGEDYVQRWLPVAEKQMVLAGTQLAQVLNTALGAG